MCGIDTVLRNRKISEVNVYRKVDSQRMLSKERNDSHQCCIGSQSAMRTRINYALDMIQENFKSNIKYKTIDSS